MKFNSIAVIIRGHPRTWNYTKYSIFYTYSKLSHNVDYYVTTWDNDYINIDKIIEDFQGRNLIAAVKTKFDQKYNNPLQAPGWLSYNILSYKHLRELTINYDAVFDQRFDCLAYQIGNPFEVSPMTYYTSWLHDDVLIKHVNDVNFMSSSSTYDLITTRYQITEFDLGQTDYRDSSFDWSNVIGSRDFNSLNGSDAKIIFQTESLFYNFLEKCKINIIVRPVVNYVICRPDMIDICPDPMQIIYLPKPSQWETIFHGGHNLDYWNRLPAEKRKILCQKHGIDYRDYFL